MWLLFSLLASAGLVAAFSPSAVRRCTMAPGDVRALVVIERDTLLPYGIAPIAALSYSTPPGLSRTDSLLATPGMPLTAARARLLDIDSATARALGPTVRGRAAMFLQARPYRADCATVRFTDSVPWTRVGDTSFVVARLAPPDQWVNNIPVLYVADAWSYPYPRRAAQWRSRQSRETLMASAPAMFSFVDAIARAGASGDAMYANPDTLAMLSIAWARRNPEHREHEPIRSRIRDAVLRADFSALSARPSPLRGTYRVTIEADRDTVSWYFRTVDKPAYRWPAIDASRPVGDVIDDPHVRGYRLVGYAADSAGLLPTESPRGPTSRMVGLVWLSTSDRPHVGGRDTASVLTAELEFVRRGAPRRIWPLLDPFVPPTTPEDSAFFVLARVTRTPADDQPRLPLTLRRTPDGRVRGDTTLSGAGRTLRVIVERGDTLAVRRPF